MMKTFHIQWHITGFCNLRCKHCYQETFDASTDLAFPEIQKLFNNLVFFLKKKKFFLIADITGGEPFLHPDFWKILEMLENCKIVRNYGIITNGTLLKPEIHKHLSGFPKLKTIKVSCEGLKQDTFEYIRGISSRKFFSILEMLSGFHGEKLLMFTLLQINADQIPMLFDVVNKYKLDGFIVERFFPIGTGKQLKHFSLSHQTWKDSVKKLLKLCSLPEDLNLVAKYRGFKILRKKNDWEIFGAQCVVGRDGCAIMHDGSVFPCRRFVFNTGNAVDEPFEKIWEKNPCINMKREMLKGICGSCKIKGCYGCRALAYCVSGDIFAEDPLCFFA